jgi:hypothetical protein
MRLANVMVSTKYQNSGEVTILKLYLNYEKVAEKWPSATFPSSFVVAAYSQVRLTPQDFGGLASRPFEQPGKENFFGSLL